MALVYTFFLCLKVAAVDNLIGGVAMSYSWTSSPEDGHYERVRMREMRCKLHLSNSMEEEISYEAALDRS